MKKIAIIGSTSHISKNLIYYFLKDNKKNNQFQLFLYARNRNKLEGFLKLVQNLLNIRSIDNQVILFNDLPIQHNEKFNIIINCIGPGTNVQDYSSYFQLTELWDNQIINYLLKHRNCLYINFSSGTVHKNIDINNIQKSDFQSIAKINSEAKHRSFEKLNILDLRLYSFFSRFADLENDKYFINELILALRNKKTFITTSIDFVRDFIHPEDLFNIIKKNMNEKEINKAIDVCSKSAVSKFEILDYCKKYYELYCEFKDDINFNSSTGDKDEYFPKDYSSIMEYFPKYSSLEGIAEEAKYFLEN
jgi:nucleoside-diphosphate-sugar epimerase